MYKNVIVFAAIFRRLMANSIRLYVSGRSNMSVQADSVINMKSEEIEAIPNIMQKLRANLCSRALN